MIDLSININVFDVILDILLSAGVAILTAWLALRHFYKQEKWLRKEKKYTEIINNLVILINYYDKEFELATSQFSENIDIGDIREEYIRAKKEIEKIRYNTGYLIDPKINVILNQMIKDFGYITPNERQGDHVGHIDRVYGVIKEALDEIIDIAEKDLNR